MENLSIYLKKYGQIGLQSAKTKEILAEVVQKVCKVELDASEIKIERQYIKINVFGVKKAEIHMHREKIIERFFEYLEKGGYKVPKDKKIF